MDWIFGKNDKSDPIEAQVGMNLYALQSDPKKLTTALLNQMIQPLLTDPAMMSTGKVCNADSDCF